jgi:hypothetical protein
LTKVAETPNTASAPNQVANTVAVTTGSGQAAAGDGEVAGRYGRGVAANSPMPTDTIR